MRIGRTLLTQVHRWDLALFLCRFRESRIVGEVISSSALMTDLRLQSIRRLNFGHALAGGSCDAEHRGTTPPYKAVKQQMNNISKFA